MDNAIISKKFSAIVLSAGKSSRMGTDKFSLMFDANKTFLEKIVTVYHYFGCNEIVVVLNSDGVEHFERLKIKLPSEVKIAVNHHPEWERFYSLKRGVESMREIVPCFVNNIDNPFVDADLIEKMALQIEKSDYVLPSFNGRGGHPFMISENVVRDLLTEPEEQMNIRDYLNRYSKHRIAVDDDKVLLNINTIDDYRKMIPGIPS